jgi:uncharacterized membrane protein YgcG
MNKVVCGSLILFYSIGLHAAQIYQWKDAKGIWQFTEQPPLAGVPYQLKELPDSTAVFKLEEKPTTISDKKQEVPIQIQVEKSDREKTEKIEKPVVIPDARTEKMSNDGSIKKTNDIKQIAEESKKEPKKEPSKLKAKRQSRYVSDVGQLLLLEDYQKLQELLEQVERNTGIEIVIFTCYTLADYEYGEQSVEKFSEFLIQHWQLNKSILIIISLLDKQLHIHTTSKFSDIEKTKLQKIRENILIPIFKEGHFSEGLLQASQAIKKIFEPQEKLKPIEIKELPKEIKEKPVKESPKKEEYWFEIVAILSLGLWWTLLRLWQKRKGRCPQCSGKFIKYQLNQKFTALRCATCGTQLILAPAQPRWQWRRCPSCGNQGFHVKSWNWLINQLDITRECRVCGFQRQEKVRLLPLKNSDDGVE